MCRPWWSPSFPESYSKVRALLLLIMEGDQNDLALQILRNHPNCNWEVSDAGSYKLQLASAALSIPLSPAPQVPSPGGRNGGRRAWMTPLLPALVPGTTGLPFTTLLCCPTGAPDCLFCSTAVLLIDPAAAEVLKPLMAMIGRRFQQMWR